MTPADIDFLAELLRSRVGLSLGADKVYLIESRLAPVARREGFDAIPALVAQLRAAREDRLIWAAVEALAPLDTSFFRDKAPFDLFRDEALPAFLAAREEGTTVRVLCAGCATGQEAYSIAMTLDQAPGKRGGLKFEILAVDISARALEKAKAGIYSQFEVQRGLPIRLLLRYFEKADEMWRISPELRRQIAFRRFNLMDDLAPLGRFDAVFCRNVVSHLDTRVRADLIARIAAQSAPDAVLILGACESLIGVSTAFHAVKGRRGLYRHAETAAHAA